MDKHSQGRAETYGDEKSEPQSWARVAVNLHLQTAGGSAGNNSVVDVDSAGSLG